MWVVDQTCAVFAFLSGMGLLVIGVLGFVDGWSVSIFVPPVVGGLPALAAWGFFRSLRFTVNPDRDQDAPGSLSSLPGPRWLFPIDCAGVVLAVFFGIPAMPLGIVGLFTGWGANWMLPPVVGGLLPGLVGWGLVRGVYARWTDRAPDGAALK